MALLDPYRRWGRTRAALAATVLAAATGFLCAPLSMYLMILLTPSTWTKDYWVAFLVSAFLAGGFFGFVVVLSWLTAVHHDTNWHTPFTFIVPYLVVVFLLTLLFTEGLKEYMGPDMAAWGFILVCTVAAMGASLGLIRKAKLQRARRGGAGVVF